jgi:hypothetical protein
MMKSKNSDRYLKVHAWNYVIHNGQEVETTQMAIDGQTDKMWYVHPVEYYPALKKATT